MKSLDLIRIQISDRKIDEDILRSAEMAANLLEDGWCNPDGVHVLWYHPDIFSQEEESIVMNIDYAYEIFLKRDCYIERVAEAMKVAMSEKLEVEEN